MLTLFKHIVAGDSWGVNMPIIYDSPARGMMLPIMQLIIAMGIMNLILAVVVDRAVEAREMNKEKILKEQRQEKLRRKVELLETIRHFDADHSGTLSREEIENALSARSIQYTLGVAG